jgi:hypothetical protein
MKRKRIVSRRNLADRLATVDQKLVDHALFDDERWSAHKDSHVTVAESLRDYKRDANEWRASLSDLRQTFIPRSEFGSGHRALEAKLHTEIVALAGVVAALDAKVDVNTSDIKDTKVEAATRRSVFSDTRSIVTVVGLALGIAISALLLIDRLSTP